MIYLFTSELQTSCPCLCLSWKHSRSADIVTLECQSADGSQSVEEELEMEQDEWVHVSPPTDHTEKDLAARARALEQKRRHPIRATEEYVEPR